MHTHTPIFAFGFFALSLFPMVTAHYPGFEAREAHLREIVARYAESEAAYLFEEDTNSFYPRAPLYDDSEVYVPLRRRGAGSKSSGPIKAPPKSKSSSLSTAQLYMKVSTLQEQIQQAKSVADKKRFHSELCKVYDTIAASSGQTVDKVIAEKCKNELKALG